MSLLPFDEARRIVLDKTAALQPRLLPETVPLEAVAGRILAEAVAADRDYPPFPRSARDGFAVRAADVADPPSKLRVLGQTRAGEPSRFTVGPGEAVEIMTGAPAPAGADAVVMVEHSRMDGEHVVLEQSIAAGRNIVPQGSECAAGATILSPGVRLDFPQVAQLASVGCSKVSVFRRPGVTILSTGDEVMPVEASPASFQIRNSNAWSIAAQVRRCGGEPLVLPIAPDRLPETRDLIRRGLEADMLILSGGVSMGKHDLVETALEELGAEIFITKVKIQPGKPFVFGQVGEKPIFGLPGNPVSTMVTFELFARPAVELLAGSPAPPLPFVEAPLAKPFRHKPVLTRFLPARLAGDYFAATVEPIQWQGSGDVTSTAQANCFLVAPDSREAWEAGDRISVLPI